MSRLSASLFAMSPFTTLFTVLCTMDAPAPTETIIIRIRRVASVLFRVRKSPPLGT